MYLEISISANQVQQELLIPTMIELGCDGFQEMDNSLLCYIDKSRWTNEKYLSLKNDLKRILQIVSVNSAVEFREIVEENWNEQWERSLRPIEVGDKLAIKPSWCDYENNDNRIVIQIDPKMSFGTGYHETTRLTLRLLEKYIDVGFSPPKADSMLDVGTGTGILAIAAIKLGATSAVGIDNDKWSIDNANENVIANRVDDKIEISDKTLTEFTDGSYNLIAANLTLNTNIELLDEFRRILCGDGTLLLSGLLDKDKEEMIQHLTAKRFSVIELISENEWIAIAAKKQS